MSAKSDSTNLDQATQSSSQSTADLIGKVSFETHQLLHTSSRLSEQYAILLKRCCFFSLQHTAAACDHGEVILNHLHHLHREMEATQRMQQDVDAAHRNVTGLELLLTQLEA